MTTENKPENENKSLQDLYAELAKKSLVKIQYSCGGNSNSIEEQEDIPVVNNSIEQILQKPSGNLINPDNE